MKKIIRLMTLALCFCVIAGVAAGAAEKKKPAVKPAAKPAAKVAVEKPAGIYEGINTEYDNYVMATYNFSGNKVKIATEKEDIDCTWKIDKTTLLLYYVVDGKPSNEVYESWVYDAAKKRYTMKDSAGLVLKKKGK